MVEKTKVNEKEAGNSPINYLHINRTEKLKTQGDIGRENAQRHQSTQELLTEMSPQVST